MDEKIGALVLKQFAEVHTIINKARIQIRSYDRWYSNISLCQQLLQMVSVKSLATPGPAN